MVVADSLWIAVAVDLRFIVRRTYVAKAGIRTLLYSRRVPAVTLYGGHNTIIYDCVISSSTYYNINRTIITSCYDQHAQRRTVESHTVSKLL